MSYGNGGQFSFSPVNSGMSQEDLLNTVAKMQKELTWLLNNLDSSNVPRLNTNLTQIQSEAGETIINGPLLQMSDADGTLRLQMGLDNFTDNFVFEMFNIAGTQTLGLDSNGDATFTGIITGSTIQTALPGNSRLTLTSAGLTSYNAANQKNGFAIEPGFLDYSEMRIYEDGTPFASFGYNSIDTIFLSAAGGTNLSLIAEGNLYLDAGTTGTIFVEDKIQFKGNSIGFFNTTPVVKVPVTDPSAIATTQTAGATYGATEQTMLGNLKTDVTNLRSKVKDLCDALQAYGLV